MRTTITALFALAFVASGCTQGHLSHGYGKATREAFAMQAPPLPRTPPPLNSTLDTQEAAVVSRGYLKGLAGKSREADVDPVLYVAPPQQRVAPQPLAPSVPPSN